VNKLLVAFFAAAALSSTAPIEAQSRARGIVVDGSGAPVPNASVAIEGTSVSTGDDGRFDMSAPPEATVRVTAVGFEPATLLAIATDGDIRVVLRPAPLHEAIVVTASRGAEQLATASATTVVTSAELLNSAGGALDDVLRNTPGFTLFRRSSSRASNPTTQGVTLRGVSGSGASRTLVLADGFPLNDAFGSWVYWNRVPQAAIDRVEIVRGAAGDLYGADALGGVVQVLTFPAGRTRLRADVDGGSHATRRGSVFGSVQRSGWNLLGAAESLRTDGVLIVGRESRGPVDTRSDSDYDTGFAAGGYDNGTSHVAFRFSQYREHRGNGTPLQVNTTDWKQGSGDAGGSIGGGAWIARAATGDAAYYQTFTAVAADRASERLTTVQTTPTRFSMASGQWARGWGNQTLLVGAEGRRTRSTVQETRYAVGGAASGPFLSGGRETAAGGFARVSLAARQLTLVLGARADAWRSHPNDTTLPTHTANFVSPRASAAWSVSNRAAVHAAAYRSYRTPSLNELHRGFRAGNILTNPNPELDPETLTGAEGGLLLTPGRVSARVTGFWNELQHAITNVTIASTPAQITRQRQNTDTVRATGVEFEAGIRPGTRWTISGVATVTRSKFARTPAQPALQGKRVPQVPKFQLGGTMTYSDPRGFTGSLQARMFGTQFDDDLNLFLLARYGVVDASVSQSLARGVNVFAAVENLLDADYDVGRTPIRTIGWPRTARVGVRIFLP
jgi:outer membrane receptor protein involved in Fe transport